jgi:hypothetical protein
MPRVPVWRLLTPGCDGMLLVKSERYREMKVGEFAIGCYPYLVVPPLSGARVSESAPMLVEGTCLIPDRSVFDGKSMNTKPQFRAGGVVCMRLGGCIRQSGFDLVELCFHRLSGDS